MPWRTKPKDSMLSVPVTAADIIACLRIDLSEEAKYLIARLTTVRLTMQEIVAELVEKGFRDKNDDEMLIIKSIHDTRFKSLRYTKTKRHGKVFGFWHGEWYVINSLADPKVSRPTYKARTLPAAYSYHRGALEDIIEENGPMTLGQLAELVAQHPACCDSKKSPNAIANGVSNALLRNPWLFAKKPSKRGVIPARCARWGFTDDSRERAMPPNDLYALMRSKHVVSGWKFDDLIEAVRESINGCWFDPDSTDRAVKAALVHRLSAKGETRFQRVAGKPVRYRALPPSNRMKKPSTPEEWDTLVLAVVEDMGYRNADAALTYAKRHGYLFGWDTLAIPQDFFENQMVAAMRRLQIIIEY